MFGYVFYQPEPPTYLLTYVIRGTYNETTHTVREIEPELINLKFSDVFLKWRIRWDTIRPTTEDSNQYTNMSVF